MVTKWMVILSPNRREKKAEEEGEKVTRIWRFVREQVQFTHKTPVDVSWRVLSVKSGRWIECEENQKLIIVQLPFVTDGPETLFWGSCGRTN